MELFGIRPALSAEQERLQAQIEVIQHDIIVQPGGQKAPRGHEGVDKDTGKAIPFNEVKQKQDRLLRDANGMALTPAEAGMVKEGWGRTVPQPEDGSWTINANLGIRTRGKDALNIVLVETKGHVPFGKEDKYGEPWRDGEERRWEFQVSRKGMDAEKPENVLRVPVHCAFGGGVLADIGNAHSSFSMQGFTGKSFQPAKVLRSADHIDIAFPTPAGMGATLAILERDPFEMFASGKAIRGGGITVPDGATERVTVGYRNAVAQIKGQGNCWGQVIFSTAYDPEAQKAFTNTLYEKPAMPQDELIWHEKNMEPRVARMAKLLNVPGEDACRVVPEGASMRMESNTGHGAMIELGDGTKIKVPAHNGGNSNFSAWQSPPVWLRGPGNKGSVDLSGLDGRVVLSGGGEVKLSQKPIKNWWYTDVVLVGGTPQEKAVYVIDIPQFDDPKLALSFAKKGKGQFGLERYPMPPTDTIPLQYPDGTSVSKMQTENDTISIKGPHIEVHVREGGKTRLIYDSDQPEKHLHSSVLRQGGQGKAGIVFAAGVAAQAASAESIPRRRALGLGAASLLALMEPRPASAESTQAAMLQKGPAAPERAAAALGALMPDLRMDAAGRCHAVQAQRAAALG